MSPVTEVRGDTREAQVPRRTTARPFLYANREYPMYQQKESSHDN